MILYHGTLESLVPEILRTGLHPRGERPSHDAYMDSESMSPFLYLTSSFGIAVQHAVRISERVHQGAPISVIEVDSKVLKVALRYPDEDYLCHEWNDEFTDWSLEEQLAYMDKHRDDWRASLRTMKVIAYKGVVKPTLLLLAPVPRWMEDGYRKRLPRKVQQETLGAAVTFRSPVTPPPNQRVRVSSRGAFRSSKRSSSAPRESRTNATSDASLGSKPRRSLDGRSRQRRRTRRAVGRLLAYITSTYWSRKFANWEAKTEFRFHEYGHIDVHQAARGVQAAAHRWADVPTNG